jgi:hypothetical protein
MPAFECLSGTVTAAGAVQTAWTMNGNDSLTLRQAPGSVYLVNAWADYVGAGSLRIRSAKMHDFSNAIFTRPGAFGELTLPIDCMQKLYSQDTLIVEQTGSAVAGAIDSGTLCLWYDNIPGLDQNLISYKDFRKRMLNLKSVVVAHVPSVIGGYGGAVALSTNVTARGLKGNTNYAVLGYDTNDLTVGTVTFQGPDTSGLRIPIPYANDNPLIYHRWFPLLAQANDGAKMIPVINSHNIGNTFIESVHSSVIALAGNVTLILAELAY